MSELPSTPGRVALDQYASRGFNRGRGKVVEALWILVSILFFNTGLPSSRLRKALLRLFGARVGQGVVIKPCVQVKFPWRLSIGDHSWIGERVWIDNLAPVEIGAHVCISQDAYLCTGSHDWRRVTFDLQTRPIVIHDGAWICARATLAPGVVIGEGAVVSLGTVAMRDVPPWQMLVHGEPVLRPRPFPFANGSGASGDVPVHGGVLRGERPPAEAR